MVASTDYQAWYLDRESVWRSALSQLRQAVFELTRDVGGYREYRPKITTRVKTRTRLLRKIKLAGIGFEDAEEQIYDIVGVRIICHSLGDVHQAVIALQGQGHLFGLEVKDIDVAPAQKRVARPCEPGRGDGVE